VRIHFTKDIAGYITEKSWHPSQRLSARADGSVVFEAEVAGTEEIKHWIMKWGGKAVVLAPQSLREEIRREAETMARNYQRSSK
jgi:predicted DNA-binding transcriptional regulator YafY